MPLHESCGVLGIQVERGDAFSHLYWGLLAQNHRGHQSHGFATFNGRIHLYKELGMIPPLAGEELMQLMERLPGWVGIGNVRYTTSGLADKESLRRNAMPVVWSMDGHSLALSFNGNIVNIGELRKELELDEGLSDAYALTKLMLQGLGEEASFQEAVRLCMEILEGAYSTVCLIDDGILLAFKDPLGIKPLCFGCNGGVLAFSSESVGLDINGLDFCGEIAPGELMWMENGRMYREKIGPSHRRAFCAFEFAYFARPDSLFNDRYVYEARVKFGINLARRYQGVASRCDVVISLPETANDAAYGFHIESGLPWEMATRRHRYVTQRAFISKAEERELIIFRKVNILSRKIRGKRLAVIDDSIVRGDTTRSVVRRLRAAGAAEVHLFITYPRIIGPCFYGIDMATYSELIGAWKEPEEVAKEVGADSVNYQPIHDYVRATGMRQDELCLGCITRRYPTPRADKMSREMWERLLRGEAERGRIYEGRPP
jgi:amidophosphoribosyltransferase